MLSVDRILTYLFATHANILTSHQSTVPSRTTSTQWERSSTTRYKYRIRSFGSVLEPRTFSAQRLSTSELLRTL